MSETIFDRWKLTAEELTKIVDDNPSLRGILLGYVAEKKFHDMFLTHVEVTGVKKSDDHNRKRKGDREIIFKGKELTIEVKSLQSNTVRHLEDGTWVGKTQVDASDKRKVTLPNGKTVNTTCLLINEFDLLAVNLFAFGGKWRFAFAKNKDLPRSPWKGYKPSERKYLLATLMEVSWPPKPPFYEDPFGLLEEMARERTVK